MGRPSDEKTFTVPANDIELIHCQALIRTVFGPANVGLEKRENPDFIIQSGHGVIGVELTQPDLVSQPQSKFRRLDEISFECERQFQALSSGGCRVTMNVTARDNSAIFGAGFCVRGFVADVARLLNDIKVGITQETRNLAISINHNRILVTADDDRRVPFAKSASYPHIPSPFALDVFSPNGEYSNPFIWHSGHSWSLEDKISNRRAIFAAIERKATKAQEYRKNTGCEELWLLVHYPKFGAGSFHAGELSKWPAAESAATSSLSAFNRVFFRELSTIYEARVGVSGALSIERIESRQDR